MSVQAMAWVFDHSPATGGERLVLLAIANHYGFNDPPLVVIAREARLSRSAAIRAIHRLETDGGLVVERDETGGRSRTNRYMIPGFDATTEGSRNATYPPEEGSRPDAETVAFAAEKGSADATRTIENHLEPTTRADLHLLESEEPTARESYEDEFNRAWSVYPRKTARKSALRAWQATRRKGVPAEVLRAATEAYALTRRGEPESFTMHGSTFYGPDARYLDYVPGVLPEIAEALDRPNLDEMAARAASGPATGSRYTTTQPWEETP